MVTGGTVYAYLRDWRNDGTFDNILLSLQDRRGKRGDIDWELGSVDGSIVRAARCAGGARRDSCKLHPQEPEDHALGRSRGGFTSKFHLVTDGNGLPLGFVVSAGQRHDSVVFEAAMNSVSAILQRRGHRRRRPNRVAGDKGYSYPRIRQWVRSHDMIAVIPQRDDQRANHKGRPINFDKETYRRRSVIEQCIGWLKECRRVATRFEKLAINFMVMIKIAIIQRYLPLEFKNKA